MDKDIVIAIAKEQEYLERKLGGDNTANIRDYIIHGGYESLDEFNRDKSVYIMKQQEYTIVEEPYIGEDVPVEYVTNRIPAFLYTIDCDESYAFVPLGYVDDGTIASYGLKTVSLGYNAEHGVILSVDGDLRVYLIIPGEVDLHTDYFISKISQYLNEKGMNTTIDNNDILLDGNKVAGAAEIHYNGMKIMLFQVTYNNNLAMIRDICGISRKTPGYIDRDVLSPYELKDEFIQWLQ